jgi:hypothetical protein
METFYDVELFLEANALKISQALGYLRGSILGFVLDVVMPHTGFPGGPQCRRYVN